MTAPEHIIRICPDFKAYLWDDEDVTHDLADLQDKEGKPIVMPELDAWAQEIEPIVVASETGQPYEKDWADFKVTTRTKGADVDNPNRDNPGNGANPRAAELAKKFHERRYGTAPAKDGANNNE